MRTLAVSCFLMLAATAPALADGHPAGERLEVGRTNIFCVKAPCPWRGIAHADTRVATPSGLLWAQDRLPQLDASPQDARRLAEAWADHDCLLIMGRLDEATLAVDEILGPCR